MPLNLAKLVSNRANAAIDFGNGDVLHVEFYPARITSEMLATMSAIGRPEQLSEDRAVAVLNSASDMLLTLLASWDLVETDPESGEERPVPLDADHLRAFGVTIQWQILNGVISAQAGEAQAAGANAPSAAPSAAIS